MQVEELLAAGRLAEADALLQARLAQNPNDHLALTHLGVVELRRGDFESAWVHLEKAVSLDSDNSPARSNLAAVLVQLANFEAAERHALAALSVDADNHEAMITLAECLALRGEFDGAEHYYQLASRNPRWAVAGQVRFSREFFDRALALGDRDRLPPARLLKEGYGSRATHVLYAACSPEYLERFGGGLVESLAASGGGECLLHLHVVGGDTPLFTRLGTLPERYPALDMTITTEAAPDAAGADERNAFYSVARFLRVPELLRLYHRPVITLDVDALVEAPTQALVDAAADADLALLQTEPQRVAWTNILAGTVLFNTGDAAEAYARMVKGYIEASMADGKLGWNLDQTALYCSLVLLRRFDLPLEVMPLNDIAKKVFHYFSAQHGAKEEDPKHRQYYTVI